MSANEAAKRHFETIELVAATLLGVAAIATAFATFQSALYSGRSVEAYSKANKLATEAAAERSSAIVEMSRDNSIDSEAMRLILEADGAPNAAAEERNYFYATYLYTRQMSEAGYRALGLPPEARKLAEKSGESATAQPEEKQTGLQESILEKAMERDLASDENYRKEMLAKSETMFEASATTFKQGQDANQVSDKFQLIAVIYAIGLFFGGIVQVFRHNTMRWAILGAGAVFVLGGTIYMLTIPWTR